MSKLLPVLPEKKSPYGKAVLDGVPRYSSASSLTTADPNSYAGCLRRWWFDKVRGIKEPETAAQRKGVKELHDPIEHYYHTGSRAFAPFVQAGFHHMPARGADLLIEREIALPLSSPNPGRDDLVDISGAPLRADGIPIVGRIDLTHARGVYVANGGELLAEDFPNTTAEAKDWKSTSSVDYGKQPAELRDAIQMVTYGSYLARVLPALTHARLSHVYFLTRGAPKSWKSTVLVDRDHLAHRWEYVDGIARSLRHAAAETDVEKVPGNPRSCGAYHKGCPHRSICSIGSHNSIPSWAGLAMKLDATAQPDEGDPLMSLLKTLNLAPPDPAATAGVAAALNLAGQVAAPTPANPIASLMTTSPNPITALAEQAAPALAERVRTAFTSIKAAGLGEPPYVGEVGKWKATYDGVEAPRGAGFAGSGKLGGYQNVGTLEELLKLAADVAEYVKSTQVQTTTATPEQRGQAATPPVTTVVTNIAPAATGLVPPETPASKPELAALPVEGFGTVPVALASNTPVPLNITTATMIAAAADGALPATETKVPATRKKRTPKVKPDGAAQVGASSDEMILYVDCLPTSGYERLQPRVDAWLAALVDYYKVDPPDIRCATKDPLGMGKWKGVVAAMAREQATKLPQGAHTLITTDSEINKIVAEALESARGPDGEPIFDNIVRKV